MIIKFIKNDYYKIYKKYYLKLLELYKIIYIK